MKTYIIYKHTTPSNKVYIGLTSRNPILRWNNGNGYRKNIHFFRAIMKYGWSNIKHEILYTDLTEEEAKRKEIELIAKYNATDLNFGYNITKGGDTRASMPEETRIKMINKLEEIEIFNYYDNPMYIKLNSNSYGDKIEGAYGEDDPASIFIAYQDLKGLLKSEVFTTGALEIDEQWRDQVFKENRIDISRSTDYYTYNQIKEMILNPKEDTINKIVAIRSKIAIENFKKVLLKFKNQSQYDISSRIEEYIETRQMEIDLGILKSKLPIIEIEKYKTVADVNEVEGEVELADEPKEEVKKATPKKTTVKKATTSK